MYNSGLSQPKYSPIGVSNSTVGRVFTLLGISFLFTALGAWLSIGMGRSGFAVGAFGSFITLMILQFAREKSPFNLILLYVFTTLEGILIGGILQSYVAAGLGGAVIDAAVTTALVSVAAGGYGATTQRNLLKFRTVLTMCLLGLIVAMIIGLFIHMTGLQIIIAGFGALLFTALLAVDMQRVARTGRTSQGTVILMTVSIYLDIVNLFMFILELVGFSSRRNN